MVVNKQTHLVDKDVYCINTAEKIKTEWEDRIVGLRREEGRGFGENSLGRDVEESTEWEEGGLWMRGNVPSRERGSWGDKVCARVMVGGGLVSPKLKRKQTESRPW